MWMAAQVGSESDTTLDFLLPDAIALDDDNGDTTGSSTDSGTENAATETKTLSTTKAGSQPCTKKRKATYYVRKDAIESLHGQIQSLQNELMRAKSTAAATLREAQEHTIQYQQSIERNHLLLAGSESMLSAYKLAMGPSSTIPLKTYIHLPADPLARSQVLESLWKPKMDASLRFMTERMRFLDLRYEHSQNDVFRLPNGDVVYVGCDVVPFTTGHSVKQVFDAFKVFILSQEITISERLGVLTIRENEDLEGFQYGQSRFLSSVPGVSSVHVESNSAMFATFVEASDDGASPAHAVAAMDYVDIDELYPFRAESCARREMTTAITFTETLTEDRKRIVTLCKWGYIRLRMPETRLTEAEAEAVRGSLAGLSHIMDKVIRERLALETPAP